MVKELVMRLNEYVYDELSDSKYYAQLAMQAPDEMQKKMILEFSADEKEHAEGFAKAIEMMTGKKYIMPIVPAPTVPDNYVKALQARVINESADYKKYGDEYLMAQASYLKTMFYKTRTGENVHALRILDILSMQHM